MIRALLAWFRRDDLGVLPEWTTARAKAYERETLERLGLAGFGYGWHRAHLKQKRREREAVNVRQFRRSA